jgi:hypothetical protein
MKKAIVILIILLCVVIAPITVYAGSLNENESAIVGVAQGEFELDGVKYKVDSSYIDALVNYLCQDDIDLTSAQKDAAIQKIYANVRKGVADGYLIPIEQKSSTSEEELGIKDTKIDSNSDESLLEKGEEDSSQINESDETNEFITDIVIIDDYKDTGKIEAANSSNPSGTKNSSSEEKITSTVIDKKSSTIRVVNDQNESLLTVSTQIKNTGFNIVQTIVVLVILATVLGVSVAVAIKYVYFARKHE